MHHWLLCSSTLLLCFASLSCTPEAKPPPETPDVVVTGLLPFGRHSASLAEEIVLETRVLTADGQPHPNAVFTWRYPGKPYRDFATDPDRDLIFVEETGPGGLQRLRIRSTRAKRGGLFVGCVADVWGEDRNAPVKQAVCENQALIFWGGATTDLQFPFTAISLGVGEVRPVEALTVAADDEHSHEPVTCSVADTSIATVASENSVCTVTALRPGSTTLAFTAGSISRPRPLTVTTTALGAPPVGSVTGLAPQGTTAGITPAWLRSDGEPIPANLITADSSGTVAFGALMEERQVVFQWTGTGFGWSFASALGDKARSPPTVAYDRRGALYASLGGLGLALHEPADPPGHWRRVALPPTDAVTGVELTQFDDSRPFPVPPEGSQWFSLLPRTGGGVWMSWVTVKGWDEYPDKLCRFTLELAEVDPSFAPRKETVLVSQKRWWGAVSGGAKFDCRSGHSPYDYFVEPVPQLLREGTQGKPELDLLRHDSVFPFDTTAPDTITLTPSGLMHRHLIWNGTAWSSDALFAPGTTRAVARSPTQPPLLLGVVDVSTYTTVSPMRQRPYDFTDDPERFFYFDDPRVVVQSEIGAASVPLPGHKAFELDTTLRVMGWRVIDLPASQPSQQLFPEFVDREAPIVRPPVILPDGRRFAFQEQVSSPFLCTEPGAKVIGAPSASGTWTVLDEPATRCALPVPFEAFRGPAFALPGEMVLVGVDNTSGVPLAAKSSDGATWSLYPSGMLPSATQASTAWVGPDGLGFALSEGFSDVYRSADVRTGAWTKIDDLSPELTSIGAALSNIRRDLTWVESANGQTLALVAVVNVAGDGPRLLVRRYSKAGTLLDSHRVNLPTAIQAGVGDRFEPTGAALVGELLFVYQGIVGTHEGAPVLILSPLSLDLATDTWTTGAPVATIYAGDPYGQNFWHVGLEEQFDMISRDFFSPLLFKPLGERRLAVFGSTLRPDGREAVFHATTDAVAGLSVGEKTFVQPDGGFHQRVVGAVPEPGGGWYLLYGDGARPYMQFGALEHAWTHVTF